MTHHDHANPEHSASIIARRNQLHRVLVEYLVTHSPGEQEAREQLDPIVREYGFDEVVRMLEKISLRLNRQSDPDADARQLYAEYVDLYRRFGGDRTFLTMPEYHSLNHERAMLLAKPMLHGQDLSADEQRRADELSYTLLSESFLWDDLVPETPPKVLAKKQDTSSGRKIGRNEPCPCGSGRKYKKCCLAKDAAAARQEHAV